jgi:hypothetical protein
MPGSHSANIYRRMTPNSLTFDAIADIPFHAKIFQCNDISQLKCPALCSDLPEIPGSIAEPRDLPGYAMPDQIRSDSLSSHSP